MALPTATWANATTPYFIPNGSAISSISIITSNITTSSINASSINVAPHPGANFFINYSAPFFNVAQVATSSINNTYQILQTDNAANLVAAGTLGYAANSQDLSLTNIVGGVVQAAIDLKANGDIVIDPKAGQTTTITSPLSVSSITNVSSINGLIYPPTSPTFLIYNLVGGSAVSTNGTNAVVVATQASSVAGRAYRVSCVYDVNYAGLTAPNDYTELQISGTGVSIFSMRTTTQQEIINSLSPGMSHTSTAVFVDADGSGFTVEIVANSPTASFGYNFYIVSVERLN